jgi:ABC-type nitrate/sulfonate/bicarbonate transport system permease component
VSARLPARERVLIVACRLGLGLLVVALWYLASRPGRLSPILLPTPEAVMARIPELLRDSATWEEIRVTVQEILSAFAVSTVTGVLLGVWASRTEHRARVVEPLLVAVYTVPIILIYPVTILLFGIGPVSKIVFAGVYGFFPVAANTLRALQTVDAKYVVAAVSMGATVRQLNRHVLIPASLPLVMSGIRIGAMLNLIGVLAGEILASSAGLGHQIATSAGLLQTSDLYAYIVIVMVLIAALNRVISRAEERPHL